MYSIKKQIFPVGPEANITLQPYALRHVVRLPVYFLTLGKAGTECSYPFTREELSRILVLLYDAVSIELIAIRGLLREVTAPTAPTAPGDVTRCNHTVSGRTSPLILSLFLLLLQSLRKKSDSKSPLLCSNTSVVSCDVAFQGQTGKQYIRR